MTESVNTYDYATSAALSQRDPSMRVPSKQMGQDDFLKVLVAQMSQQDPFSPSGDLSSISQMASFSSLEQLRSMQTELETLKASSLIGRTVEVREQNGDGAIGIVEAVHMEAGKPQVVVGGKTYNLDQVRTITQPQAAVKHLQN